VIKFKQGLIAIVQARTSSKRLPGKVLFPFGPNNVIGTLLERVNKSKMITKLLVATSNEPSDDELSVFVESLGYEVNRGSLNNVFERFYNTIENSSEQYVLRITADCPLLCGELIDETFTYFLSEQCDFLSNSHPQGIVRGFDLEFVTRTAFLAVNKSILDANQREHVMPVFYRNHDLIRGLVFYEFPVSARGLNLSIDTRSDYDFLKKLDESYLVSQLSYQEILNRLGLDAPRGRVELIP